jgi:hypothetical protein
MSSLSIEDRILTRHGLLYNVLNHVPYGEPIFLENSYRFE